MNKLGTYIRNKRNEKGMLLRQLSAELCVDSTYLSKIERGERNCNREFVKKIALVFNTNIDDLIVLWLVDKIATLEKEEPLARKAINHFMDFQKDKSVQVTKSEL